MPDRAQVNINAVLLGGGTVGAVSFQINIFYSKIINKYIKRRIIYYHKHAKVGPVYLQQMRSRLTEERYAASDQYFCGENARSADGKGERRSDRSRRGTEHMPGQPFQFERRAGDTSRAYRSERRSPVRRPGGRASRGGAGRMKRGWYGTESC